MKPHLLFAFWFLAFFDLSKPQKTPKIVHFLSSETTFDRVYLHHFFVNISRKNKALDINAQVIQTPSIEPHMLISVFMRMPKKRQQSLPMISYEFNLCEFLTKVGKMNKGSSGFIITWLKGFWSSSTFPQCCPITEGIYSWLNLNIEKFNIPSFFPKTIYDVTVLVYLPNKGIKEMVTNLKLVAELK
ncbi:uncharacterized protein LOC106087265 [Stomoxys calcitrans]|uniref:uncharacterized protein LOC106087265 n=1 Tax=Stomoxys calcitrans TaxID=35570 RepID=UPI0027E2F022|nr:uncharacterized protein LOC106087265 [Stomoxys calcitrans]